MPQCPHCQAPYESGQRYCSTCGSFLLHPEEGDTFCPQCGVRVSPRQEFCHECDAPLKGAKAGNEVLGPEPEPLPPKPPPVSPLPAGPRPSGTPSWLIGLLVGTGIVIIILLILLFTRGTPPSAPPPQGPKASAPAPPAPATPVPATPAPQAPGAAVTPAPQPAAPAAADLKGQLQNVLNTLRGAQLQKNIILFMSTYSLTYPELDEKRAATLRSWEDYDFTNMTFKLDKVQLLDPKNAVAEVTWYIDARNRRTQQLSDYTQTYQVRFAEELGKWRIRSLEEVEQ
jgi:hypothetical protein